MERYRKNVYCEIAFIRDFLTKSEDDSFDFKDNLRIELLHSIKGLIFSNNIKLHLDTSLEDFEREYYEISKKRLKAAKKGNEYLLTQYEKFICDIYLLQINGELHVKFLHINFPDTNLNNGINTQYLDAIYLLYKDKDTCQEMMDKYGILVICPDNLMNFQNIPLDTGIAIRKDGCYTWYTILKDKIPCSNSMIIVDNYINKDLNENLTAIFDASLPEEICCPMHISIFTSAKDTPLKTETLEKIENIISSTRPKLKYTCSIYICSNEFHDRNIITNNIWISCGAGFDLFHNNKAKNATTLNVIYPFINKNITWTAEAYSTLLSTVKKIKQENIAANQTVTRFYVGNPENRLIESD